MPVRTLTLGDGSKLAPTVEQDVWLAPDATVAGNVVLERGVSIWYSAVLRSEGPRIAIGAGTNVQDGAVVHADPGFPCTVGQRVSVGHRAVLHGCIVEDDALVGIGAVVLNGSVLGRGCLVAAGTVITPGSVVEPASLVAGVPGRHLRYLTDAEISEQVRGTEGYVALAQIHAGSLIAPTVEV